MSTVEQKVASQQSVVAQALDAIDAAVEVVIMEAVKLRAMCDAAGDFTPDAQGAISLARSSVAAFLRTTTDEQEALA